MLQQTQVLRVIPKYTEFIEKYPSVEVLSKASPASVLRIWKGMGYNRRALYLQKAAIEIVRTHNGIFPKIESELRKLPGLGIYTARAILVFAYKQEVGLVDTNIRQIITHFVFGDVPQSEKVIQEAADALVPKGKSWEWHQALMDYGSSELKKIRPVAKRIRVVSKVPFKDTDRFFRGRIMDLLREKSMSEHVLVEHINKTYSKPADFIQTIIQGLVDDGLIQRIGKSIQLPE